MNTIIRTLPQVQQAQADAWVYGLSVAGLALVVAFIVSLIINWRTDRRDFIIRRIWAIVIGFVFPVAYWFYNEKVVANQIQNPGFRNMFEATNLKVLIVSILTCFIIGWLTMFLSKRGTKWRSLLPKKYQ